MFFFFVVLKKSTPAPPRIAISKLCDLASQLEKLDGLRHKETKTGRTKFILENRVDNSESSGREVEEAQFPAPTKTSCKIKSKYNFAQVKLYRSRDSEIDLNNFNS